ncbi:hypothetical protein EDF24_1909 [Curtobacterium sp. PhB130]|uniref:hypothetical protein n=1 Tax=Curtobacterium sp. PhB130 TaxID=2485178 RepID=UPI000F4CB162|nr:hypothetical protein [Curtobacterium sp. PhB130]ROS76320.1 hypothetical protein EDF24_1909 [Curtobacterium sp. PhB130]
MSDLPPTSAPLPPMPGSRRAAAARSRTMIVTGAAGGVGTTTVAALLVDAIGGRIGAVVQASDHATGDLAARIATLDQATSRHGVHDIGVHPAAAAALAAPSENAVVVVMAATPDGIEAGLEALAAAGSPASQPVAVVVDRAPRAAGVDDRVLRDAGASVVVLRRDEHLARPGRVSAQRLAPATTAAVRDLLTLLGW